jgi:glycosyl transferase, family 25
MSNTLLGALDYRWRPVRTGRSLQGNLYPFEGYLRQRNAFASEAIVIAPHPEPASVATAIRVISLDTSVDRRRAFIQMAHGTKLDWEFFPAYRGTTEPLQYHERIAVRHCGRSLSAAEIGCYASHFKLWEWLSNSEFDQAIIFEDDVIVDWAVIEKLAVSRISDYGIDLLRLHTVHPFNGRIVKHRLFSPNSHVVLIRGIALGAAAYLLSKSAARTLVSIYYNVYLPLDWILPRYWEHMIVNYCMFPFPVIERYGGSTIGEERHAESDRTIHERISRIAWRIRGRAKRAYADHCLIKKYPLGPTKDSGPFFIES